MTQVEIPKDFLKVYYNSSAYPGNASGFLEGANCQHFCYEILRHNGFQIGDLRSSNLWEDCDFTKKVDKPKPFDILLFNSNKKSWGAHVGLFLGEGRIIHLAKKIGIPVIWTESKFYEQPEYKTLVGIKRPTIKTMAN